MRNNTNRRGRPDATRWRTNPARTNRKQPLITRANRFVSGWKSWPNKIWAAVIFAIGLGASLLAYPYLVPSVAVITLAPLTLKDLYTTPFVIQNTGHVPIRDVVIYYHMNHYTMPNNISIIGATVIGTKSSLPTKIKVMSPGENSTIMADGIEQALPLGQSPSTADLSIEVTYDSWLSCITLPKSETFRFRSVRGENGNLQFEPVAVQSD